MTINKLERKIIAKSEQGNTLPRKIQQNLEIGSQTGEVGGTKK